METLDELNIPGVPQDLMQAYALDDVRTLLCYWSANIAPIPEEAFGPSHPEYRTAWYVNEALTVLCELRLTDEERAETLRRFGVYCENE